MSSAIQMVHYVLEVNYVWDKIVTRRNTTNYHITWDGRPFKDVKYELKFATPYRKVFIETYIIFQRKNWIKQRLFIREMAP